jgi:DNA-3-methyladenine glycosylase
MAPAAASRLERRFFARPAPVVACDLVGKLLVRADDGLVARLVETEAYTEDEPACHGHRGMTRRNAPLFGPPGHAYVYFTYGMHWCLNTATGTEGRGEGVLLRAAEPLAGLETLRRRRGPRGAERDLLRGPARLAQAFGLDGTWSAVDLCGEGPLHLADDGARPQVVAGPRVGVAVAADHPWRFVAAGSPWASAYKRHPRAAPPAGV